MAEEISQKNKGFRPLVSIVIPVFNGSNYMREAIDSALSQTYDNIEVIVVNDGSTDDTESIAQSYGDKIRYFAKKNGGVATALNLAIREAKGEYISWLSHDDVYYPDKLKKQIAVLNGYNGEKKLNTILASNYSLINESSQIVSVQKFHENHDKNKLSYPLYLILKGLVHGCTLLIPKRCFFDVGFFNEELKTTQDYDLWFSMFPKYAVVFMPDLLVKSRWHAEQGSKKIEVASVEADALWIKMVSSLTDEQKILIDDSVLSFYENTYRIVEGAGYNGVSGYLREMISKWKKRDVSKILVSVIIPFHNRIDWTLEAIWSVIKQTHSNLEIIVIDDASTESIEPIIQISHKDSRVKLISNQRKSGVSGARNSGMDVSNGEYIAFLDSDDLYKREKISTQLSYMVRNGILFSHTSYETFFRSSGKQQNSRIHIKDYIYPDIIAGCSIATPTVMIAAQLFRNAERRFPEKYSIGEDICYWISLASVSNCRALSESLTKVRIHGSNAANDYSKQIIGIRNILDYVFEYNLNTESIEYIHKLNALLFYNIEKVYGRKKEGVFARLKALLRSVLTISTIRNLTINILTKVLLTFFPSYRMLSGNNQRCILLLNKLDTIEKKIDELSKLLCVK